jgi:hypothetical protein
MPPQVQLFYFGLKLGNLIGPSLKKSETMVASQYRKFCFESLKFLTFGPGM